MTWIALVARLVLGGLLGYAGVVKLVEGAAFVDEVANYRLFSGAAALVALALPATEVVVGSVLVLGPRVWRRAALLVAALLLVTFTVAMASAIARAIDVNCGCFGSASSNISVWTVARNLVLLGLVATAWVAEQTGGLTPPSTPRACTPPRRGPSSAPS